MKQTVIFSSTLGLLVLINLSLWAWLNQPHSAQPWNGVITGVSFNPMRLEHNPSENKFPSC